MKVNVVVPLEAEKEEEYVVGSFVERKSESLGIDNDDDDDFEYLAIRHKKLLDAGQVPSVGRASIFLKKMDKRKNDVCGIFFFCFFPSLLFIVGKMI